MVVTFRVIRLIIVVVCLIKIRIITSLIVADDNKLLDGSEDRISQSVRCSEKHKNQNLDECHKASKSFAFKLALLLDKYSKMKKEKKNIEISESITDFPCQCGMTNRLMDLGNDFYPRYIQTGVCKKNSCGTYQRCQPKRYRVRVLRKRDSEFMPEEQEIESSMPESLAENWVDDHVKVVIACECNPRQF